MYGKMPLISAVEDDTPSFIKVMQLCRHGAIIDARNKRGLSALCIASFRGLTSIVKLLLDFKADMNFEISLRCRKFKGFTPLMFAALAGRTRIVRMLILAGADGDKVTDRVDRSSPIVPPGSSVMDIMCTSIDERFPQHTDINPDTRDLLHRRCCRACGKTTQNLEARHDTYMLGDMTGPEPQQNLHRCAGCPTDIFMGVARYCSRVCQKNDWAPGARTHRNVCPGTKGVVYRSR